MISMTRDTREPRFQPLVRRPSQNKYRAVRRNARGWVYLYPVYVTSAAQLKMGSYGEGD